MTQWDAIIVGAGISGLSVGAMLAEAGKKVLVLEKSNRVGGRLTTIEYKGHIIDNGVHGLSYDGFLEEIFSKVGKEPFKLITDIKTVVFHDGKFQDLVSEQSRGELKRIFLDEILSKTYEELEHYHDTPLSEWVGERTDNPEVKRLFSVMGMFYCPSDYVERVSAGDLILRFKEVMEHSGRLAGTSGIVEGGNVRVYQPLADAILENGGEIRTNTMVSGIVIQNGKACGVEIPKGKPLFPAHVVDTEMIEAPVVVCTLPLWNLFKVICEDEFPRWYVDWVKEIQHKVCYVMGIYSGLDAPLFENEKRWYWVPDSPRMKKLTTLTSHTAAPGYGASVGQYQVAFNFQTLYDKSPDLFSFDQAKVRKDLRRIFDDLEEDVREMFPEWEKHCLWKLRYAAPIDIATAPGFVGKRRPDRNPPGIKNLYLVSDTLRRERGNWTQSSAFEALHCADQILSGSLHKSR